MTGQGNNQVSRLHQMVEGQLLLVRYATRLAVAWEGRWQELRSRLAARGDQAALQLMDAVEEQLGVEPEERPEPEPCEVNRAQLGEEGSHHCRTHRVWFNTQPGEPTDVCPVGLALERYDV